MKRRIGWRDILTSALLAMVFSSLGYSAVSTNQLVESGGRFEFRGDGGSVLKALSWLGKESGFELHVVTGFKDRSVGFPIKSDSIEGVIGLLAGKNYILETTASGKVSKVYLFPEGPPRKEFKILERLAGGKQLSVDDLEAIFLPQVRKENPAAVFCDAIPRCDANGRQTSAVLLFSLSGVKPVRPAEVKARCAESWKKSEKAREALRVAKANDNQERITPLEKDLKDNERNLFRKADFLSLVVGVEETRTPIIAYYHGLPWEYTALPSAMDYFTKDPGLREFQFDFAIEDGPLQSLFQFTDGREKVVFDSEKGGLATGIPNNGARKSTLSHMGDWENVLGLGGEAIE